MAKFFTIKVGVITGLAVLVVKLLSTLLVYRFLTFDVYLAIVAVGFLLAGMLLVPVIRKQPLMPEMVGQQSHVPPPVLLTNRELAIFEMLGKGLTNKEIAETLCIQVVTVKSHINTLYQKIGCKNRVEAREKWKEHYKNN